MQLSLYPKSSKRKSKSLNIEKADMGYRVYISNQKNSKKTKKSRNQKYKPVTKNHGIYLVQLKSEFPQQSQTHLDQRFQVAPSPNGMVTHLYVVRSF